MEDLAAMVASIAAQVGQTTMHEEQATSYSWDSGYAVGDYGYYFDHDLGYQEQLNFSPQAYQWSSPPPQSVQPEEASLEEIVMSLADSVMQEGQRRDMALHNLEEQLGQIASSLARLEARDTGKLVEQTMVHSREDACALAINGEIDLSGKEDLAMGYDDQHEDQSQEVANSLEVEHLTGNEQSTGNEHSNISFDIMNFSEFKSWEEECEDALYLIVDNDKYNACSTYGLMVGSEFVQENININSDLKLLFFPAVCHMKLTSVQGDKMVKTIMAHKELNMPLEDLIMDNATTNSIPMDGAEKADLLDPG